MPFKNAWRALAVAGALAVLAPAGADAKIIELGVTDTQPKPSCPDMDGAGTEDFCLAVAQTTGYQNRIGAVKDPFVVPRDGRIVAWTVVLSRPKRSEQNFFAQTFGGEASAAITVLDRPEEKSTPTAQQAVAVSGIRTLTDYLGKRVQFPLIRSLPVLKGQRVALTVPTWAPVLADGFPGNVAWRASRENDGTENACEEFSTPAAMTMMGATRPFECYYKTARLSYFVTLVTEPRITKEARQRQKREEQQAQDDN